MGLQVPLPSPESFLDVCAEGGGWAEFPWDSTTRGVCTLGKGQ